MRACMEIKYKVIAMILAKLLQMKIQVKENILFVRVVALTIHVLEAIEIWSRGNKCVH
jgi:hypothetical protein